MQDEAVGEGTPETSARQTGGLPADGTAVEGHDPGAAAIVSKSGEEKGREEFYIYIPVESYLFLHVPILWSKVNFAISNSLKRDL